MRAFTQKGREVAGRHFGEAVRFVTAGALAATTHLSTLYLLTEFTSLWYLPSTVIGFGIGFLVSFTLQKYWTFREYTSERMYNQLTAFFLLQASGLFVNTLGLYVLVEYVGLWYLGAQVGLLIVVAGITYALSKWVIFTSPEAAPRSMYH